MHTVKDEMMMSYLLFFSQPSVLWPYTGNELTLPARAVPREIERPRGDALGEVASPSADGLGRCPRGDCRYGGGLLLERRAYLEDQPDSGAHRHVREGVHAYRCSDRECRDKR